MSTVTRTNPQPPVSRDDEPHFERIEITNERITAFLSDERTVSVPLWWSWRLEEATAQERQTYELIGSGRTAYWPDIDEHLSVQGFLQGTPAPRPGEK
jgi:hypothetical protein